MTGHRCIVCGKSITWQFGICKDCELVYGPKARDWPEWLRFLWADQQRVRRKERIRAVMEVSLDSILEYYEPENASQGKKVKRHEGWL